jgi:hypothetical protein
MYTDIYGILGAVMNVLAQGIGGDTLPLPFIYCAIQILCRR